MPTPHPLTQFILDHRAPAVLPAAALAVAKEMLVNAAAVGLAGAAQEGGFAVTRFAQEMGGNGKCTLIGKGLRTSPVYAALANGLMIALLDFDDAIGSGPGHPSAVIFPPVMAVGEMNGSPGREVLAAFILGSELAAKLGHILPPDAANAIAAAAAAGYLLDLDAAQLESALALALAAGNAHPRTRNPLPGHPETVAGLSAHPEPVADLSAHPEPVADLSAHPEPVAGLSAHPEPVAGLSAHPELVEGWDSTASREIPPPDLAGPARAYRQGLAAMQGMTAALLARQGLAAGGGLADWLPLGEEQLTAWYAALGQPYALLNPGVRLKLYPCAAAAHTAIEAALQLMQQYRTGAADIAAVTVRVTPAALAELPYPTPADGWQARHCLSYIVAATLTSGPPLIDTFTEAAVAEGAVRRLMDLITVAAEEKPSPSIPYPCSLEIALQDGRRLRHRVEFARGQPELPLSPEELDAKFLYCSRYILPPDHIEEAITGLRDLENIGNTTGLFSVLGG